MNAVDTNEPYLGDVRPDDLTALLRHHLTAALRARDSATIAALRSALSAIANAEAVPAPAGPRPATQNARVAGTVAGVGSAESDRRLLSPDDIRAVIAREIADRRSAAGEYEQRGHPDAAARLRAEAAALSAVVAADPTGFIAESHGDPLWP